MSWVGAWNEEEGRNHAIFFFNDTATTEIYTLSLHDALPISIEKAFSQTYKIILKKEPNAGICEYENWLSRNTEIGRAHV